MAIYFSFPSNPSAPVSHFRSCPVMAKYPEGNPQTIKPTIVCLISGLPRRLLRKYSPYAQKIEAPMIRNVMTSWEKTSDRNHNKQDCQTIKSGCSGWRGPYVGSRYPHIKILGAGAVMSIHLPVRGCVNPKR